MSLIVTDTSEIQSAMNGGKPAAKPGDRVGQFVSEYLPLAKKAGGRLGVEPHVLLGQWGLETGWGKSVIPGTRNLGNIKDFSNRGPQAKDNMTGSVDAYRSYESDDAFVEDFARLLEGNYGGVKGAGGDAQSYFKALKNGKPRADGTPRSYAEDPDYVSSGTRAANLALAALGGNPAGASSAPTSGGAQAAPGARKRVTYMDETQPTKPRTTGEAVEDVLRGGAAGVVQGVGMLAGAFGADNRVAQGAKEIAGDLMDGQSEQRKEQRAARSQAIQDAEASGSTWEEIKANLGMLADAPVETIVNAVGTSAPTILSMFIPGLGQANAARLVLQGAVGAAQGAGSVKGSIYEAVERKLIEEGQDADTAAKVAAAAQAYDGKNGKQILAGSILGAAAGTLGLERSVGAIAGKAAGSSAKTIPGRAGVGAIAEGLPEGAQGGQERMASNIALQNEGFDVPTFQGVAGQAAGEAAVGAVIGGGFGAATPARPEMVKAKEAAAEPNSPLSRAAVAGNPDGMPPAGGDAAAAPGAAQDPIAQRAAAIEAEVRDGQLLEKLREIGQPGRTTTEFLDALATARNPQADQRTRQQALESLEMAMGWIREGKMPSDAAKGSPFSTEVTAPPAPPETSTELATPAATDVAPGGMGQFFDPNVVDVDATRVDNMVGGPRAIEGGRLGIEGPRAIEGSAAPAPAPAQPRQAEAAAPAPAPEAAPAEPEVPARPALAAGRRQVPLPRVSIPEGAAPAFQRREAAQIEAAVKQGFDTVERRGDGVYLVNPKTNQESKLSGLGAMQRARQIIRRTLDAAASQAASSPLNDLPNPTEAQAKAGNYKKGSAKLNGFEISIENPVGSTRSGTAPDGTKWETTMASHYGYFKGTEGADGDQVDVFIGPRPDLDTVFVVDQIDPKTGMFDEHKVMMGYPSIDTARAGYLANYEEGWQGMQAITQMPLETFRAWVKSRDAKKPAAMYDQRPQGDADVRATEGRNTGDAGAGASRAAGVADRERGESAGASGEGAVRPERVPDGAARAKGTAGLGTGRTAEDQAAVQGLSQALGRDIELADPDRIETKALNSLLDAFALLTGQRGVAIQESGAGAFDGVTYEGRFFVNINDPIQALSWTIGHEFKHVAERSKGAAALYQRIWDQFPQSARAEYLKYLHNTNQVSTDDITQASAQDMALLKDEMVADFMGQRFNDKAWLTKLAKQKPALFGEFVRDWLRILDSITTFLEGLMGINGGRGSASKDVDALLAGYAAQLKEAKAIAMEVAAVWAQENPRLADRSGISPDGVVYSAREDDMEFPSLDEDFFEAELQAQLQAELEAEMRGANPSIDDEPLDAKEIKAAGLQAEDAMGDLFWEKVKGAAYLMRARVPDLHTQGKTAAIDIEENQATGRWAVNMKGTWVGPTTNELTGYASLQGAKDFARRYVASYALRKQGFDLLSAASKAEVNRITDGWRTLSDMDVQGLRRYGKAERKAKSLKEIADAMGLTEEYKLTVNNDAVDPTMNVYNLTFEHRQTGVEHRASFTVQQMGSRKNLSASTVELTRGGMGAAVYQLGAEFAVRRGIPLSPESSISGVNTYRRTEQMLSAALRTGKSNAMVPHPTQRVYGFNEKAATEAEHSENIARLALANLRGVRELAPEIDELTYSPETNAFFFLDGEDADGLITEILARPDSRAFGLGRAQLARASMTRQMMEGQLKASEITSFAAPVLYSAREEAGLEYQAVRDQHLGKSTWMLAPNGRPTKLSERQWIQVRTPSFKKWFGDWEAFATKQGGVWNDEKGEVSKAVDPDTGEPLVVYHGTNLGGFYKFRETGGKRRGDLGIFTTPNWEMARSYIRRGRPQDMTPPSTRQELEDAGFQFEENESGTINLIDVDGYVNDEYPTLEDAVAEAARIYGGQAGTPGIYAAFVNQRQVSEEDFQGANWNGNWIGLDKFEVFDSEGEIAYSPTGELYMTREEAEAVAERIGGSVEMASPLPFSTDDVVREARSMDYSGAIISNVVDDGGGGGPYMGDPSDVYVVFDPADIKSADFNTGEFGENDDIRFSKREANFTDPEERLEVSTAYPTAVANKITGYQPNALTEYRVIDSKDITDSEAHVATIRAALREYNALGDIADMDELKALHDTVVSNLLWLHDHVTPQARDRARLWYDGANRIATDWGKSYGLSLQQAGGILAVLSPQMDWFKNVSLAERAITVLHRHGQERWSAGMTRWSESWLNATATVKDKQTRASDVGRMRAIAASGQRLSEMDVESAAYFIRAFDEAYFPREYRLVTPEGGFGEMVQNGDGKESSVTWGSFGALEKVVSIYRDGRFSNVSERLGVEHKVRNFYNNIVAPGSADGHVTIDTHAVAAALLKPLSGGDKEVQDNLGGLGSTAATGASGSYALFADAYRDAAKQRGLLAREMQSITWEAVRTLFPAEQKKGLKAKISNVWDRVRAGEISRSEARDEISAIAGGITSFAWEGMGRGEFASDGATSFLSELPESPVLREVRTLNPKVARDSITVSLSAASNSIPGIKALYERVGKGDAAAHRLLQDIAFDALRELLSGTSASLSGQQVTGLYGGSVEPSLAVEIRFAESERTEVLAALARFADNFDQEQVHVRQPAKGKAGQVFDDGSYTTPVYRWDIGRALTNKEIQKVIDKSGLYGLSFGDGFIEAYYVGDPKNGQALDEFTAAIDRANRYLGEGAQRVGRSLARLWSYGRGDDAIGYERIRGDLPAGTSTFSQTARRVAEYLNKAAGVDGKLKTFSQAPAVTPKQRALQSEIAQAYEALPDNDLANPRVRKAYAELTKELERQYNALPIKIEVFRGEGQPYVNSTAMRRDMLDNNHLFIFSTDMGGFGPEGVDFTGHPLLEDTGMRDVNGTPLLYNDLLRGVHDYFAHGMSETQFGPLGEEAAWKNHMATTSNPWARWALTMETRAQNSWVNFNAGLDPSLKIKDRPFARQKAALIPVEYALTGDRSVDDMMRTFIDKLPEAQRIGSKPVKSAKALKLVADDFNNDIRFSARATETPAFKAWFGESKVVDAEGRPLVVYHGTTADFSEFSPTRGLGGIFFTTNQSEANEYAGAWRGAEGGNIVPAYLAVKNPMELDGSEWQYAIENNLQERWIADAKQDGHDGVLVREFEDGGRVSDLWVAFRPEQIKSAIGNRGAFDAGNPDIRMSARAPGELFFSELANQIERATMKQAPAAAWKTFIKALPAKGVKPDEIEWTGVSEWLDLQQGKVPKEELLTFVRENGVRVEEVVLGQPLTNRQQLNEAYERAIAASDAAGGAMNPTYIERLPADQRKPEEQALLDAYNAVSANPEESYIPEGDQPKYGRYTLPGGENYREVLLTLPLQGRDAMMNRSIALQDELRNLRRPRDMANETAADFDSRYNGERALAIEAEIAGLRQQLSKQVEQGQYRSNHWSQANVLAHLRLNDRTDVEGKRVLFVEEIQSDWGQEGKKKGFATKSVRKVEGGWALFDGNEQIGPAMDSKALAEEDLRDSQGGYVPAAPFVTKTDGWLNLALKRVIGMAVDQGYDRVAFVTGEQSADRYDLSKSVQSLGYDPKSGRLQAFGPARDTVIDKTGVKPEELEDYVGKEVASKLLATDLVMGKHLLDGEQLKVGGEGMKAFYDKIVPAALKVLLKKLRAGQMMTVDIALSNGYAIQETGDGFIVRYPDGSIAARVESRAQAERIVAAEGGGTLSAQPGFEITDGMRETLDRGLPLFSAREPGKKPSKQTDSEAFKKWFGTPGVDSTMVNEDGSPMRLFHGTTKAAARQIGVFRRSKYGAMGPAVYLGDSRESSAGYDDGAMLEVYARGKYLSNMEWTRYISQYGWGGAEAAARADGYSGVYDSMFESAVAVWDPADIKSATSNNGEFDGGNPDIRMSARATETPAFKAWFGDSKVVDKQGRPLVVYHGGMEGFGLPGNTVVRGMESGYRPFFTAEDRALAEKYARGGNVAAVYLRANPIDLTPGSKYIDELLQIYNEDAQLMDDNPDAFWDVEVDGPFDGNEYLLANSADVIDRVRELGFDSMKFDEGGGSISYATFSPSQVKSATDNSGAFDGSNPDIRFSARTGGWDAPEPTRFDDFVYKAQDKLVDLKRVIQSITKSTGAIAEDLNAYLQEELFHGRSAKRAADFGSKELKPLMEKMAAQGLRIEDVEEYLHARHAREANRVIAERNPDVPDLQDGGSGMSNADADAYMAALTGDRKRKLEDVAADVDAIIDKTRQLYVEYGLESQDTVDSWKSLFQHYIPLQREEKDGASSAPMGIGQGFSVKGKETKGRTGSKRKVVDILGNIAQQRERLIVRGEKNRVAAALVGLAGNNPNPGFWSVGPPPAERVYDPKTNTVVERVDPMYRMRDNVVVAKLVYPDGDVREIGVVFNEDNPRAVRLATALKNLDAGNLEGALGVSAKVTRYFSSINTQYNPVFGVVNLIRDVQGALINLGSTPLADSRARIAKDTMSALAGIYSDVRATRKGGQATSAWAALWDEFQREGGQTGYRELFRTGKDRADALQKILTPDGWADTPAGKVFTAGGALKVPMSQAKKGAEWIFNWLSDYNEALENGVRLAAYKSALSKGMSKKEAASLAKNLTVNFNRRGQLGMQAGAVYAFFNAAMQGSARLGQLLFDMDDGKINTLRLSKTGKKVVYGGIMLGSLQALLLAAAGFSDEDPPEFQRERSLIIPTGGKTYVAIPMPLGLHVIPGVGRHLTEFALGGFEKPAQRAVSMLGMFADSFNPIGNAGMSMQTIAPTILDPFVALTENRDYTGRAIARTSMNPATPGHALYKDTASTMSKLLAEAINTATGGNEYVAGAMSPTPDQIDYLVGQVTGGVGRELSKLEQSSLAAARGEDLPTYKIPLLGRFVGNAASQASEGTAFYANVNRLNELETEVKGLRGDGKAAEAQALLSSRPDAYLIGVANATERQVQRLRKEKRELLEQGASREAIRGVELRITEAMARLNRAAERLEGTQRVAN